MSALVADRGRLGLAPEVATDLDELRMALRERHVDGAVALAQGELLPGMDEDWIVAARDELADALGQALAGRAHEAEAGGDLEAAARWTRRQVALDPVAEAPARDLIPRLAAAGDRGRALSAYEDLASRLRRELRTVPSAETRQLVAAIRAGAADSGRPRSDGAAAQPVPAVPAAGPPPPAASLTVRYARSRDGLNLAFGVTGSGDLDVVVVPGFVSHLEVFSEEPSVARFMSRLGSFARVLLWDKREQGLSDRPGRTPTLEQSADDLLAVPDAAGIRRPSILALSEGGPMALLFAATHPERVGSLVLYGTSARVLRAYDYPLGLREDAVRQTVDRLTDGWGGAPCLDLWAPSRVDEPAFTAWWSRLLRSGSSPGSVRAIFELNYEIDVREILPAVLVVHAREDRLLPERLGRFLAEHIPRARFVSLPSGDHIPFPTVGDELAAEVQAFLTGDRPAPDVERVLTTLLFTDVVGSTERAAQPGDRRWRDLLQDYRGVAREQLARLGGREVSTSGEGMLARFDGPARAVQCGQAIVAAAAGRGLAVRAGVHTGECELVGDDLAGLAVHIGARIAELAAGGEVLVSSTVKDLVFGSELRFAERGEHELRGLPGRWRLFSAMP